MEELKMSFDPNTIEHLGIRMYSTLPPVFAELIANAYDADAEHVWLRLNDKGKEKEIIIEDDGMGMSFDEINNKFLRIGRARRIVDSIEVTPKGRKVIGKKGLGKLSFFGIAHEIEIITKKEGKKNVFSMCWEDIKKTTSKEYNPKIIEKDEPYSADDYDGTKIILKKIQRESDFSADNLADSISKLFIVDLNFKIIIQHNSEKPIIVDNERKYRDLEKEIEWHIPEDLGFESDYDKN
jgi:HSP90 family molecular chaperone